MKIYRNEYTKYLLIILGGFTCAAGMNLFIVPLNLYSGGVIGISQISRTLFLQYGNISGLANFDFAGILNFLLNIPLFILAYRSISRKFFLKTLLCVIAQTVAFSIVMIPKAPILDDTLASCLIGGLLCGFSIGLALRCGGSGGGLDILGVFFMKKFSHFSVGKLSMIINAAIYLFCAIVFDVQTAIYSIIYMSCFSLVLDKAHYQNINMTVMVFTKNENVKKEIMTQLGRGLTYWQGAGAYTNSETQVLFTVINKYEVSQIKKIIYTQDPSAFVIFNEGLSISGNFEKRI